ncbi:MAG: hypothetical protein ACFFEF_04395 [Candidatus Thorarchaeota archaeon]
MAEDFSIPGVFSQKRRDGTSYDPVGRFSGIGGLFGLVAGAIGLLLSGGLPLIRLPNLPQSTITSETYFLLSAAFLGLLSIGLILQMLGSKELKIKVSGAFIQVGYIAAIVGLLTTGLIVVGGYFWTTVTAIQSYVIFGASVSVVFVMFWQMFSIIYTDASKGWIGFLATILNGFFFPVLAIGYFINPILVYLAYIMLIAGQFMTIMFWWSPIDSVREYARSTEKAKFAFGFSGVVTFLIGGYAVLSNLFTSSWGNLWTPLATPLSMNYNLVWAFIASLLLWVLQGPRLGRKELKAAHISDDLVSGGIKWFSAFLAAFGLYGVSQAGTGISDVIAGWILPITWSVSGVLFLIGAVYMGRTDVLTGLPLVVSSITMSVYPFSIAEFVIIPFMAIIVTQILLMVETKIRGFTYYSQPILTMVTTILFSLMFLFFMLGLFGSGPAAIWPTNRWFNVALFPAFPMAIQAPTVMVLPILALIVRNVAVVGYGHGHKAGSRDVISGITLLFSFLIPVIASAFKGVAHQALTAASIMLALYAISFVLVLSLNLGLAGEVEDTGNPLEGMILRMTAIVGIAFGALIAAYVLFIFSAFPTALEMSLVITFVVILVSGLEIMLPVGWLISGFRLGMFKSGFSFTRVDQALKAIEEEYQAPVQ